MQNQEECGGADGAAASATAACEFEDWGTYGDEDILQQKSHISAEEAEKIPFVADKVRLVLFLLHCWTCLSLIVLC